MNSGEIFRCADNSEHRHRCDYIFLTKTQDIWFHTYLSEVRAFKLETVLISP